MLDTVATPVRQTSASFDGAENFWLASRLSKESLNRKPVFPTGERAKVINPNAKPIKLEPPQ